MRWDWRTHGRPLLIIVGVLAVFRFVPDLLIPPSPAALEQGSERIGWAPAVESDEIARDIFERVNDERVARGLQPLLWHEGLADLARRWSEEMIATTYEHSPDHFRVLPDVHGIGENIAMGPRDAGEAHVAWMLSDGHRQNLLAPDYSLGGFGVVCRNDGHMWLTQMFGMPSDVYSTGPPPMPPVEPIARRDDGPRCTSAPGLFAD